jgi:pimeloyl-ACP methyl ester carboxylesterase
MDMWQWFSENEKVLSGIAAAFVILGAFATVGRNFLVQLFYKSSGGRRLTLAELSKPSPHPVQFANCDGVNIAFSTHGKSSPNLLVTPGIISNLHISANLPPLQRTMAALAKFSRVINFDKRGQGLSDPVANVATMQERVQDIHAVADASGADKFVLMGISEGGPMSVKFAAENPDRVCGLILFGTTPKFTRADDYAIGLSDSALDLLGEQWGEATARDILFPSISRDVIDDDTYKGFEMLLSDKRSLKQIVEYMKTLDVRELLKEVQCPTLVIHFSGDLAVPARMGRYMADRIPNAEYLEIAGVDHCDLGSAPDAIKTIQRFMASAT